MRYLRMSLTAAMTIFFIGCAKQNVSYVAHAQTIHPMVVPVDTKVKTSEDYYPVLSNAPSMTTSPSLVPPGSSLQRLGKQSQLESSKTIFAAKQQKWCSACSYYRAK